MGALSAALLWLTACGPPSVAVGDFTVHIDADGALDVAHARRGPQLSGLRFVAGEGSAEIEMRFGAFRFTEVTATLRDTAAFGPPRGRVGPTILEARGPSDEALGVLTLAPGSTPGSLLLEWSAAGANRLGFSAACAEGDAFLGFGGHAMDVDHVGQAFPLWVSEPGVGKSEDEAEPPGWPMEGTRHATSYPVPFALRPASRHGLLLDTGGRVDVDLCAADPDRFQLVAWDEGTVRLVLFTGDTPLDPVRALSSYVGRGALPQPWVFAPWNDAIRGSARVREVAATLRDAGAPASVIWTEDWKGAHQTSFGYHLGGEWTVDEGLYPDAAELARELEDDGFKWFAYFAPFVRSGTLAWDEASEAGVLLRDADGEVATFTGFTFETESMLDLTLPAARAWAQDRMQRALDLGFDGWMADFAEWLPTDTALANGQTGLALHNTYPEYWQATNLELIGEQDATFFVRSGWTGTARLAPVVWAGDQRTSFDEDDGLPSVIAMGLGLGASGVPVFTHDVAGYQSVGNPPSTKALWFRWAWLGAFSPILRTHHGAFDTDNWQFDSDAETTAHWARVATEHMALFPYRYGLAARAAADGTPMLLPPALVLGEGDWGRRDAWMLGDALLVAPVLEADATSRHVELPAGTRWYDWWTHAPAESGTFEADLDHIPVFAAAGTTVPLFVEVPETLVPTAGRRDLADVDGARRLLLFGGGGPFLEADGTRYTPSGAPTGAGELTATLTSGTLDVAGVRLAIDGSVERTYTVVVIP